MNFIKKHWINIFRVLIYVLFIISFGGTVGGLEGHADSDNRYAFTGTGLVAAACIICITPVELYLWNEKKKYLGNGRDNN